MSRIVLPLLVGFLLSACGNSHVPDHSVSVAAPGPTDTPSPATPVTPPTPILVSVPGKCAATVAVPQETHFVPNSGKRVTPLGRITKVGNFPTGGAITPDGRFYWSAAAGLGTNDLVIVELATGKVMQKLPMPGTYGQVIFSADGKTAYASGISKGSSPTSGPTMGDNGDVIHVFLVDTISGTAVEKPIIILPTANNPNSSARTNTLPPNPNLPSFPVGMALTPDGKTLVVALYSADVVAVINTATGAGVTVATGKYPFHVAIERSGRYAYVTNAYDGSLTRVDLTNTGTTAMTTTVTGLGGPGGDINAQPQYVLADPKSDTLYVAVTNQDGIAVVNSATNTVIKFISLKRPEGYGTQPTALALAPDGGTLYVSLAGDNAVAAIALTTRGTLKQYDLIGKIPTADYTSDIDITPDGCTLVWTSARGFDPKPNPNYGVIYAPGVAPVDSYVPALLTGFVGVLPTLSDAGFASLTAMVDANLRPTNFSGPPADGTPIHGAANATGFAPSAQIKYVFYIVKENRTYDQIFGSDLRGDGQANLEVFGDNGKAGPSGGITPNAHALSRQFQLFDNMLEDSEVSTDGHVITTGSYASNYDTKSLHADYAGRGRPTDLGLYPVSFPPKFFLFDQAATQGVSFHVYGERSGGLYPAGVDAHTRSTAAQAQANSDASYPSNAFLGCIGPNTAPGYPDVASCTFDCGLGCNQTMPPAAAKSQSRMDIFNSVFTSQVASCTAQTIGTAACQVPSFNYLIMVSDHTNGNGAGNRDPKAMVADNDYGIGQFVDVVSHSAIWPNTAIFIVEDDAQDGPDHVDAHRSILYVASPYAKHGGSLNHTRYDQYSVVRTLELMLGLQPLALYDATATPLYDAFTTKPDLAPYTAIKPTQNLFALSKGATKSAALSAALPWDTIDAVPQQISDRILWESVYGDDIPAPPPGPNASTAEQARTLNVLRLFEKTQSNPAQAKKALRALLVGKTDTAD